jgi:hypothetical protein
MFLLRQEAPQRGVMPAELVTGAVTVGANAAAELSHFLDQMLSGHPGQVFVHQFVSCAS